MAYDPGMQRGMPQRSAGAQPGQMRQGAPSFGGGRPPQGGRPPAPPMGGGGMGRRGPTVGQSLASQAGGMEPRGQEDDFLVNLGFGALKDAYQRELQTRSRVPGTNAPPMPGRMERFSGANRVPRYGAPPMGGGMQQRPRPPMGGGGMRPRPPMGGGMRPRPPMMQQQPQMGYQQPQMGYQQPMMQRPMMAPPPPPTNYGGFGSQPMASGYYNPYMF